MIQRSITGVTSVHLRNDVLVLASEIQEKPVEITLRHIDRVLLTPQGELLLSEIYLKE